MYYSNLIAKYYDLMHSDITEDIKFFSEMAKIHGEGGILELGVGTGRVALSLAKDGHYVTWLDSSPAMLEVLELKTAILDKCARERIHSVVGDMAGFSLERKFTLIIIPFNAFQHLLTPLQQESCFTSVKHHLAVGGRFIVTMFNPDIWLIADRSRNSERRFCAERIEESSGEVIRHYEELSYDIPEQTFSTRFTFERWSSDGKLISTEVETFRFRWNFRYEMEHLLRICGFEVEAIFGNYERAPFPQAKDFLIFVCTHSARK